MSPSRPEQTSLMEQERALAQRLAELPAGSPPADLDARILAEARAAVATAPSATGQRHRVGRSSAWRRPVRLATAATLVLALGLVWQLRLSPDASFQDATVPSQVAPAATQGFEPDRDAPALPPPTEAIEPAPASQAESTGQAQAWSEFADDGRPARAARQRLAPESALSRETSPAPSHRAPAMPAIAPAPEPEPLPPMEAVMERSTQREAAVPQEPPLPTADSAAFADIAPLAAPATPVFEPPPAAPGIPADLDAGIQEIRRLLTAGQGQAARNALDVLLERYPDAALPPDLAGLRHLSTAEPGR